MISALVYVIGYIICVYRGMKNVKQSWHFPRASLLEKMFDTWLALLLSIFWPVLLILYIIVKIVDKWL